MKKIKIKVTMKDQEELNEIRRKAADIHLELPMGL